MKNIFVLTLLSLALFISCQKEKTNDEQKVQEEVATTFDSTALPTTAVDESEDQSFSFRYKFEPGKSFKYRLTTISEREQSIITDSTMIDKLNQTIIFIITSMT